MPWADVEAISFDVGGTLVAFDGGPATAHMAKLLGLGLGEMRSLLEVAAKRSRFEPRELAEHVASELKRPGDRRALERLVRELRDRSAAASLYPDAIPALSALRARGYRIYLVSNVIGTMPSPSAAIARYADAVFCSSDTGHLKPERAAFQVVEDASACAGDRLLHVGDSLAADVGGALASGWHAVLVDREPRSTAAPSPPLPTSTRFARVSSLTDLLELLPVRPGAAGA